MSPPKTSSSQEPISKEPFTPILDELIDDGLSLGAAAIYGVIRRYESMSTGWCFATMEQIGQRVGLSVSTVRRHVKELKNVGLIRGERKGTWRYFLTTRSEEALDPSELDPEEAAQESLFDQNERVEDILSDQNERTIRSKWTGSSVNLNAHKKQIKKEHNNKNDDGEKSEKDKLNGRLRADMQSLGVSQRVIDDLLEEPPLRLGSWIGWCLHNSKTAGYFVAGLKGQKPYYLDALKHKSSGVTNDDSDPEHRRRYLVGIQPVEGSRLEVLEG